MGRLSAVVRTTISARGVLPLLLLPALPTTTAAQGWDDGWTWGGAVGVAVGGAATGNGNCGSPPLVTGGGEVRGRRGALVVSGLLEGLASGLLNDCTSVLFHVTRNDSVFGDFSGVDIRSPRVGLRVGAHLPLDDLVILPTAGLGLVEVEPHAHGFEVGMEMWWSGAAEVVVWRRLAVRLEHGRYRGLEALDFMRTVDGEEPGRELPLFTRKRWEPFTLWGILVRF